MDGTPFTPNSGLGLAGTMNSVKTDTSGPRNSQVLIGQPR